MALTPALADLGEKMAGKAIEITEGKSFHFIPLFVITSSFCPLVKVLRHNWEDLDFFFLFKNDKEKKFHPSGNLYFLEEHWA